MPQNDWKSQLGVLFANDPDVGKSDPAEIKEIVDPSLPRAKQILRIELDKRNRKGKAVTLISGFACSESEVLDIAKRLKMKCGVGGSSLPAEILLQGDFRNKAEEFLKAEGFKTKKI